MTTLIAAAPVGENPPVPPDTQEGPGEVGPGEGPPGHDPRPDPSEDAPGSDEGHPESPDRDDSESRD